MQTATNPQTGETVVLVDGGWQKAERTASNDKGEKAYFVGGKWLTDTQAAAPKNGLTDYDPARGLGEAALQLGTGAAGAVAGGISGLGTIATNALGLTDTDPAERVAQVSNALTYEPRTAAGKAASAVVNYLPEKLADGADWAGGKTTDLAAKVLPAPAAAALGAAVNTGIQSLPMLAGRFAKAIPGESAASIAERAKAQSLAGPTDAGVAAAREAGLKVTPTQAGAGPVGRAAESLAGSARLEKGASRANAPTINALIRKDVGLPEDVPITREALADIRKEEGAAYEAIKNTGRFDTDAKYKADLYETTKSFDTAAKDFSHRAENPIKKVVEGMDIKNMDAASAVEEVKNLRGDADKAFRGGDKQLGTAYKKLAQALDDQLDRHLQKLAVTGDMSGDPGAASAVEKYQAARVRIAKTYAAEKALNETTGNINAAVYASEQKKGKKLSGPGKQVADFARQFPDSVRYAEKLGPSGPTYMDMLLAPVSKEALLLGARPAARSLMLTDYMQNRIAAPRDYGPPRIRRLQDLLADIPPEAGAASMTAGQQEKLRGRR